MAKLLGLAVGAVLATGMPTVLARVPSGVSPCGMVAAFGSVWVANDGGTLARISPGTSRATSRVKLSAGTCSVASSAGALWVTNYKRSTVVRVDPRSGGQQRIAVDAAPFDVLVAFGRVWVTAWEGGKLDVIDAKSLRVVRRIDIGPRPMGLTVARGAIWVGFGRDATSIARVDP